MNMPFNCPKCDSNNHFEIRKENINNSMIEILVCNNCNSGVGVYNDYIQKNIAALTEELKSIGNQVKKMKMTIDGIVDVGDITK